MTTRAPNTLQPAYSWRTDALCAQTDPDTFYPDRGESVREAKITCLSCTVRTQCLDYALDNNERFGVWGGLTDKERRALRRGSTQTAIAEAEAEAHAREQARTKAVALLNEGVTDSEAAEATGLARSTVARLRDSLGLPNRYAARTPQDAFNERARQGDDGHMGWVGSPAVTINNRRYTASQLAFQVGHGREPQGSVTVTCGCLGCVNPSHLADQAMREQQRRAVSA